MERIARIIRGIRRIRLIRVLFFLPMERPRI